MKLRRSKFVHETVELNITAFLNLMVILVPFLLITAVFSRMTVLELTLPPLNAQQNSEQKIELQLQMLVYPDQLILQDATLGPLKAFKIEGGVVNWKPIGKVLLELKTRFPEKEDISLLLDKSVPYSRLVEVMDHVRAIDVVNVTEVETYELFPEISIGKAPATASSADASLTPEELQAELESSAPPQQEAAGE